MRDDAVLRRALPLGRGLGRLDVHEKRTYYVTKSLVSGGLSQTQQNIVTLHISILKIISHSFSNLIPNSLIIQNVQSKQGTY